MTAAVTLFSKTIESCDCYVSFGFRVFSIYHRSCKIMFPISYLVYSVNYQVCLLITYLVYSVCRVYEWTGILPIIRTLHWWRYSMGYGILRSLEAGSSHDGRGQ